MKKQKICIVGGGLTGLVTAITLSRLNIKVDFISGKNKNGNIISNRTTAISQNNYDFLKKLKIFKFSKKEFWPCAHMKLYTKDEKEKFNEIFEIKKDKKQVLYMLDNSTIIKHMIRNIKKNKLIKFKRQKKISGIVTSGLLKSVKFKNKDNSKYNLIIICTGSNSNLPKIIFDNQFFGYSYKEVSITAVLRHSSHKNNIARQIFLDNEILALLPISNTKTSIVWTVKKNIMNKYKNKKNFLLQNKIKSYTKHFYKKVKFISNIEFKDLNLLIRKIYYRDRVLLFGDALHEVHPLAGQGFNMVLRDLAILEKTLKDKIGLGLDIGSSDILSEFSNETKSRNFVYAMGIDFLKNSFSFQNQSFKKFRNKVITSLNKSNFVKDVFFNLADKGLKF
jgi:2-octaprenyl-6-methoxyphenol hydroxylase